MKSNSCPWKQAQLPRLGLSWSIRPKGEAYIYREIKFLSLEQAQLPRLGLSWSIRPKGEAYNYDIDEIKFLSLETSTTSTPSIKFYMLNHILLLIAGGTLVDRYGGKVVMAWGVALWSLATLLTPWAAETSLLTLLAMRMLLGIAEGVALPCMNNMISRWFPRTERSRAVALAMAGFQLGSAIGLTLSPIIMSQGGMYGPFVIFGLSGFLWVLVWVSATSSTPDRSPQISMHELRYILNSSSVPSLSKNQPKTRQGIPPFRRLLSKLPTWSLIIANAMHSWGFFVILSWMPIYFKTLYHVDLRQAAWFSAVPWSMMALVGYVAGVLSDMMIQSGISVTLTRKIMQSIGFIGPGLALIGLTMARTPFIASAWLTLAVGLKAFSHCGFLVNLQEIAPQYSGVLHGMFSVSL
ncbi:putative anion transporter 4, chloroplastic [Sesamum angolense]|uniref:Anion transporter 4, chloroplastic n=1 Tax=Sesamum angolense TaxID=2727404 RepID=A0AAE1W0E0_9LAMI|nr:putative anion transporter 4, chloroplastic [Sesamum angolense]